MPCGCKKKALGTQGELNRGVNGYLALTYNDGGAPYGGTRQEEQVIVVGRLTEDEKLFLRDDLKAASDHAKETMRPLIIQPASNLPSDAVTLLFESDPLSGELEHQLEELEPAQ